jgi:PKD repeat protein
MKNLHVVSAIVLAVLFVLPSALALGTNDMEPKVKVLVWTDGQGTVTELKAAGVSVLEEYGTFALVKGTASTLKSFDVMKTDYDLDTVDLTTYIIDHRTGEPALPAGLGVDSYGPTGHYIVQFYGPIKQAWLDELASKGAIVGQYLPSNAYIVKMDASLKAQVEKDPKVQYVGIYQPAYKIQMGLLEMKGPIYIQAEIFKDSVLSGALADISEFGDVTFISKTTMNLVGIKLDASEVPRLARIDAVLWVELKRTWVSYTTEATWIVQSGVQDSTPMYDHGIHGENQTVFNSDTGIWVSHEAYKDSSHSVQFSNPASNTAPDPNHRKIVNYWTFADNTDMSGAWYHGTHTNGVTAGDATPNGGTFHGIAWAAKISFGDIWYSSGGDGIPADLNNLFIKGFNDGARVSSNSWGLFGSSGLYDAQSQQVDQFSWDHLEMQIDFAAGNDGSGGGTVSTPSTGKDILAIGAAAHDNNGDMMGYSSRGPTQDGRIKPEIYTPTDENGPCGSGACSDTAYATAGGTSNACPTATGGMALLRQYYTDGFYPSGAKDPAKAFNPTSALMRATVVNGAIEKQGQNAHDHAYNGMPFPNNDQGFGYMNLHNALVFQGEPKKIFVEDHTTGLSTGQQVEYYFNIVDSLMPFKVSVAWTDPPGQPQAGTELVNNIDMTVEGPSGSIYKGNVFRTSGAHESSPNTGQADAKNNIEQFLLLTPQAGGYSIKVTATNIAKDTQPFAIVVNGNFIRDPDLAILPAEFKIDPQGTPTEGQTVYLNGTVHNYGGLVTQLVPMDIIVDGKKDKGVEFDFSLADKKNFSYAWKALAGNHRFDFIVDPLKVIKEADENNNQINASIWANGIPHANLTIGPDSPLTLMDVFANASKSTDDGPIGWFKFDFGDGFKTQWQKSPVASHQYKDNGIYNITTWVKDNMSVISDPAKLPVEILNRAPVVNATAATYIAYTFSEISFDGVRSYDPDGKITYLWDFGDGATAITNKPIHNWSDDGAYQVTLTVTDDDGASNSTKLVIKILNQAPTASFSANVYRGNATTDFKFNATGKDRDGHIASWVWDFGDGNTSSTQNPTHHYGDDGEYNVSFYNIDDDGAKSAILNRTVVIDNLPPIANLTASSYEAQTLEDIKFMDLSKDLDGRIVTVNWDMGDGKVFRNSTVTHAYKENGVYTVKLTVQDDDDAISTVEVQVTIKNRAPVAKAIFNATAHVGTLLVLTGNQSTDMDGQVKTYIWTFNGTEKKYGQTVTYAFWQVGVNNFTLTVFDNDGASSTANLSITISKKPVPPPYIIGGTMSPFMLILIVILIGCVVGAIIGAVVYSRRKSQQRPPHPGAQKVATVPLTSSMELESASAAKATEPETQFESAYQHQAYGKVEAYPFYGKEVETASPTYDYGPGYDATGVAETTQETAVEPEVVEEPAKEPVVEAPEEEEEFDIKPVVVEHDAVAFRVAEPEKAPAPETKVEDTAKKAREKEIKESNDLDEILSLLDDKK